MKHFLIDKNYGTYLSSMGFSMDEVLKKAMLPENLFARQAPSLTAVEYFRFMGAIDALSPDEQTPIRLAASEGIEAFSPPIFAAYCSRNALVCLKRLAQYKPLIGALLYQVEETETEVSVEMLSGNEKLELPEILVGIEFVFLVGLIRKATKENVIPVKITVKKSFVNPEYEQFLGRKAEEGATNSITFSHTDVEIPFITRNESMWNFFEPELRKRLGEMDTDDSFSAKVRSVLVEILPAGKSGIEDVAAALGMSRRSLQRKLKEEDTTFQKQLNHVRELLAKNYIQNTQLSSEDIAYLLGYQDLNSFFRAFSLWTGKSVTAYKQETS